VNSKVCTDVSEHIVLCIHLTDRLLY